MKIAVAHQKAQIVKIVEGTNIRELARQDLMASYKNLQHLLHQCLLQMSDFRSGDLFDSTNSTTTSLGFEPQAL